MNGRIRFQSLRKNVTQALQSGGVPEERRRAYMGHEPGEDTHRVTYMRAWTPQELEQVTQGLAWNLWLSVDSLGSILLP